MAAPFSGYFAGGAANACHEREAKPAFAILENERELRGEIEGVEAHHPGPRGDEVGHEFLLRISAGVNFGEPPQLRVRAEDQVDAGAGPLNLAGLAVAALIDAVGAGDRLPFGAHVEQVD